MIFVSELRFKLLLLLWITEAQSEYKIGIGIADVTGPPTGVTFVSKYPNLYYYILFYNTCLNLG